jgi:hypothetical protein
LMMESVRSIDMFFPGLLKVLFARRAKPRILA